MRASADKLTHLAADRLRPQVGRLQAVAVSLRSSADKLDEAGTSLIQRAADLSQQSTDLLTKIVVFRDNLLATLDRAFQSVNTAMQGVNAIDLAPAVTNIHVGADGVTSIASNIDDGNPIGTPGKKDLVQKLHDLFDRVRKIIPSLSSVKSVIRPIFSVLAALHVAILVVGVWLIIRGAG